MKKTLLLIFTSFLLVATISAQNSSRYFPLRLDLGLGAPVINSSGPKQGIILYAEPGWYFKMYKVGVRFEGSLFMYMKSESSTVFTLDRFFTPQKNNFRPFVGAGIGSYYVSEAGGCSSGVFPAHETTHTTGPLGGMLRTGFELNNFRLSIEYNAVQKTYVRDFDPGKVLIGTQTYTSSYFGFKAGFSIRARRRK